MSGSTFSAYAGANVVAVGLGIGYNRYWNTSGNFIGANGYIGGYVGIPGLATYGGGYEWGNGDCHTGWYQTASLYKFNWRDDGHGWYFQGFDYNMNICSYNSHDPNNYAVLKTEHDVSNGFDPISHSAIDGVFNGNPFSISWGPNPGGQPLLNFIFGCNSKNTWPEGDNMTELDLSCVSVSKLYQYSLFAGAVSGILPYNVPMFSCAGMAQAAIYSGGMSYLGFSPYFLEFFAKNKF